MTTSCFLSNIFLVATTGHEHVHEHVNVHDYDRSSRQVARVVVVVDVNVNVLGFYLVVAWPRRVLCVYP
ncbi:MAG TPA: hypothetical protein VGQ81_09890 [Acidobacteriota bacterium]|nr:hypothetical protein [Acidobacteriota bacterium]